ncbi:MAG: hypothetical protein WAM96_12240 [Candidatus Acidiferrales bacterium]
MNVPLASVVATFSVAVCVSLPGDKLSPTLDVAGELNEHEGISESVLFVGVTEQVNVTVPVKLAPVTVIVELELPPGDEIDADVGLDAALNVRLPPVLLHAVPVTVTDDGAESLAPKLPSPA